MAKKKEDPNQTNLWGTFFTSSSTGANYNYTSTSVEENKDEVPPPAEEPEVEAAIERTGIPKPPSIGYEEAINSFMNQGKNIVEKPQEEAQPKTPVENTPNPFLNREPVKKEVVENKAADNGDNTPLGKLFSEGLSKLKTPQEEPQPEPKPDDKPYEEDASAYQTRNITLLSEFMYIDENKSLSPMPFSEGFQALAILIANGLSVDFFIRKSLNMEEALGWLETSNSNQPRWRFPNPQEVIVIAMAIKSGKFEVFRQRILSHLAPFDFGAGNTLFWAAIGPLSDIQNIRLFDVSTNKFVSLEQGLKGNIILVRS
ncbi:MAG: hypothetical protein LBL47_02750 [Lactobacillus sp.]|jgi:hypothetical protein|nr:hypothetical protein [Lactobacillus sp.]